MSDNNETSALDRLRAVLPHIKLAASMAKIQQPDGQICLAIISKNAEGKGSMGASFEAEPFFADLEAVTSMPEVPPVNLKELLSALARSIVLSDHLGDVHEAIDKALQIVGLDRVPTHTDGTMALGWLENAPKLQEMAAKGK